MRILAVIAFFIASALATPALALMVTNLDRVPHVLTINENGSIRQYTIQPNGHVRTVTWYAEINIEKSPVIRALHNEQYVIWPHGRLSIQSYRSKGCCVF